ncbi:MAG: hypothetical protein EXR28_11400 [Betaproteobacteria bacterium]|nr:hypothetical protein [Betaproteobacteria bacterium]
MLEIFAAGLFKVFTWPTLPLMLLGTAMGFVVGILPGLGGVVALALMLPFTFGMEPVSAFAFLLGMLAVTGTTGDITSILFGVPGEAVSAATIVDGHPMAKNGEAGRALGASLMSSLLGAIVGALLLAAAIPIIRPLVLGFASPEFFALALLGVMFMAAVSGDNILKGLIAGGLGLILSMVGLDSLSGIERYTFGRLELWEGISLVAITTGIFGLPEIIDLWARGSSISHQRIGKVGGVMEGVKDTFRHWGLTLKCSALGTFMGIIPGLGASIGQWMAYAFAVQSSSNREKFGKGDVRGVIGPSAANNSSLGGGLIPTIAFGVPGNVAFAILLGAFLIQGLVPGPAMLTTHLHLVFSFVWIIVVTNVITVAICFMFINQLVKITEVRGALLIPSIIVLILLGGYVETHSWFAMFITLGAGAMGFAMVHFDWPRPPLILGLVLGTLVEKNLFTSYQAYGMEMLSRPVVILVLIAVLGIVLWSAWQGLSRKREHAGQSGAIATDATHLLPGGLVVLVALWALWEARNWPFETRLFPWVIGIPVLTLALAQLAVQARRLVLVNKAASGAPASAPISQVSPPSVQAATSLHDFEVLALAMEEEAQHEPPVAVRRERQTKIVIWCAVFALIIVMLGFKVGSAVATFFFLRFAARESRRATIALTTGTYLFFLVTSDVFKLAALGPGLVADWLGLDSLDAFVLDPLQRALSDF